MRKTIVLGLMLASVASGVVVAKLHTRYQTAHAPMCTGVPCAHYEIRMKAIESQIAQAQGPHYLALGDSFIELADMPEICGRKPINAGIGNASVATFLDNGPRMIELAEPDFVVVSLGTNDALQNSADFRTAMQQLLSAVRIPVVLSPLPLGRGVPQAAAYNASLTSLETPLAASLVSTETVEDGIHLTARSYVDWKANIVAAAENSVCLSPKP